MFNLGSLFRLGSLRMALYVQPRVII